MIQYILFVGGCSIYIYIYMPRIIGGFKRVQEDNEGGAQNEGFRIIRKNEKCLRLFIQFLQCCQKSNETHI